MQGCKETLKDTLESEDYEDEGFLPMGAIKECFVTLDIDIDDELLDYVLFVIHQKSESIHKMKYSVLFELLEGKITQG